METTARVGFLHKSVLCQQDSVVGAHFRQDRDCSSCLSQLSLQFIPYLLVEETASRQLV
jgi:hypothetical protein